MRNQSFKTKQSLWKEKLNAQYESLWHRTFIQLGHELATRHWPQVKSLSFTKTTLSSPIFFQTTWWNPVPFDQFRRETWRALDRSPKNSWWSKQHLLWQLQFCRAKRMQENRAAVVPWYTRGPCRWWRRTSSWSFFFLIGKQCLNALHYSWSKRFVCSYHDYRLSLLNWLENGKKKAMKRLCAFWSTF